MNNLQAGNPSVMGGRMLGAGGLALLAGAGVVTFAVIRRRRTVLFRKNSLLATGANGVQCATTCNTGVSTGGLYGTTGLSASAPISTGYSAINNNNAYYGNGLGLGATTAFANTSPMAFSQSAPTAFSTGIPTGGLGIGGPSFGVSTGGLRKGLLGGLLAKAFGKKIAPSGIKKHSFLKKLVEAGLFSFFAKKFFGHKKLAGGLAAAPIAVAAPSMAPGMASVPKKSKKFFLLAPLVPLLALGGLLFGVKSFKGRNQNKKQIMSSPIPQRATLVQPVKAPVQHATLVQQPVQKKRILPLFRVKKVKQVIPAEEEIMVSEPVYQQKRIPNNQFRGQVQQQQFVDEVPVQKTRSIRKYL